MSDGPGPKSPIGSHPAVPPKARDASMRVTPRLNRFSEFASIATSWTFAIGSTWIQTSGLMFGRKKVVAMGRLVPRV
jgi:hypothetical protein